MTIYTNKILFVHIPKTAGASIIKKIKKNERIYNVLNNRTENDNYHSTAKDCLTAVPQIQNLYKFTIVRNPWDRACSWFYFRKNIIEKEIKLIKSGKKSKKCVNNLQDLEYEMSSMKIDFNNWLIKYINLSWDYTWFSLSHDQHTWLEGLSFDKIIKFENLNQELEIMSILDMSNLPHRHRSINSIEDYRSIYNQTSIDLIEKIYKKDIKKFGYKFE